MPSEDRDVTPAHYDADSSSLTGWGDGVPSPQPPSIMPFPTLAECEAWAAKREQAGDPEAAAVVRHLVAYIRWTEGDMREALSEMRLLVDLAAS